MRTLFLFHGAAIGLLSALIPALQGADFSPAIMTPDEQPFQVRVEYQYKGGAAQATLKVEPVSAVKVTSESLASLPEFNPKASGWKRGAPLAGVRAQETTTPGLIDGASVVVAKKVAGGEKAMSFVAGKDYQVDPVWGTVGRLAGGAIETNSPVVVSYQYWPLRLDNVVVEADGKVAVIKGQTRAAAPLPPEIASGQTLLGRIWLPGKVEKLDASHLFPVLEEKFPEDLAKAGETIEKLAPKTVAKLLSGEKLKVLAWGDSVTNGQFLPNWQNDRWQVQFVTRLKEKFPKANIELITEAWPGKNTRTYLAEPAGADHHYPTKVLGVKPDLIVSEFVNDAGLDAAGVAKIYGGFLRDFREIGAEWIILTPHYTYPEWMKFTQQREIDQDSRAYVTALRGFSAQNKVALADASLRYGRLWRQGLPYTSLLLNSLNHPDRRGMKIFADALMQWFDPVELK